MSTIWHENGTIETEFPEQKFNEYVKKAEADINRKPTLEELEEIFLYAVEDFKKGPLSLDGLAEISGRLFGGVTSINEDSSELAAALISGGELSFYIRMTDGSEKSIIHFGSFLNDVIKYYENNKYKLVGK